MSSATKTVRQILEKLPDGSLAPNAELRLLNSPAKDTLKGLGDERVKDLCSHMKKRLQLGRDDSYGNEGDDGDDVDDSRIVDASSAGRILADSPLIRDLFLPIHMIQT